ncbi:putative cytochrome p450 [Lyophyllum shimeji]|uniref:Cytochrome p450 n=1 Tax=Lyophyllum shimeji TaxID=47721 RepID=A0A9P3PGK3_LYOSH|nr:putative cytochrome p450 [Lyophyllum shimeji]
MAVTLGLRLFGSLAATLTAYGLYRGLKVIYEQITSPLRHLPGPKSKSWIYGNFKEIWEAENSVLHEQWIQEYGPTIQYAGILGMRRLYTTDTKALNHILMHSDIYEKPDVARYNLSRVLGEGVLVVEGDKHRQQRKVMNPAFGPSQVRELTEIFFAKAIQLRDIWAADNANQGGASRVDALSWLSRTTLDVIGLAGFNYNFNALSEDPGQNELNAAFSVMFKAGIKLSLIPLLRGWFPLLRFLRTEQDAKADEARKTMNRIANQLLRESKASIHDKSEWKTRDLLSLLVKSNMDTAIPENQRMTDQDVLAQVPTFLVAGHETTSTGTTWALYALTQDKRVQDKLRQELLAVDTDTPTMDELNALPYLDMVVRETMRVHAPVASTIRSAVKDDILPLSKPFTDRKGVVHDTVRVNEGQTLLIPILAINRDKSIWGEDAMEFRPERWEKVPEAAAAIPGVWGNMLTFLGGPRACIGYRFSLVETKALLFTLIRAFEFELAVPVKDIVKKSSVVQRPVLVTDPEGRNQMPLLIKSVVRA